MRSLSLQSLFSTSPSTVSFSPDDCAPSVSTTLGHSTLASEEAISIWDRPAWRGRGRARRQPSSCASEWPGLWVTPPRELPHSLPVWLLLLWSWTACCCDPGGTACFIPPAKKNGGETKNRGEKINSSLNKFVKAAWKGVQHLLCRSCQAALTLGMLGFTWQIAHDPAKEEGVSFV